MVATVSRQPMYPVKSTGNRAACRSSRAHRPLSHYDKPCINTRIAKRPNGIAAPMRVFLHR
jgi:hypothetical protein